MATVSNLRYSPMRSLAARAYALAMLALTAFLLLDAALAAEAIEEGDLTVAEIRIVGNSSITSEQVRGKIKSREGRPFDRAVLDSDLKAIVATHWFADVNYHVERDAGGRVILSFLVRELPILTTVEFRGMKKLKLKDVEESTGLKKGARADMVRAQLAVSQIKQLYQEKGYERAEVKLIEGGKAGDTKVVFQIFEGPKFKVGSVDFVGNTFVSDGVLQTKITSKTAILGLIGGAFQRDLIEEDRRKLTEYYQANGFLEAKVSVVTRSGQTLGEQDVQFVITEGVRFKVRNLIFEGNKQIATETLRKDLKLHSGEIFNDALREADRKSIENHYFELGCIDTKVMPEPKITEQPGVVDLVYRIEEDVPVTLGEFIVKGNARTREKVVLREAIMAGLLPGEPLRMNRLELLKKRLANQGYWVQDPQMGKPMELRVTGKRKGDRPYREVTAPGGDVALTRLQSAPAQDEPPPLEAPPVQNLAPPGGGGADGLMPFGTGRQFDPPPNTIPGASPIDVPGPPPLMPIPGRRGGRQAPADRPPAVPTDEPPGTFPSLPLNNDRGVGPDRNEPFANRAFADITANLDEAPTGRLLFGLGASSYGGLSGNVVLHESNFDLFAIPRSFSDITNGRAFRGAGQEFRLELSPGTAINRYIVSFRDPYLFDLPIGFGASGYQFSRLYTDFNERRSGGRFSLGYQWGTQTYLDVAFRIEDVTVNNFNYPAPAELLAASGHTTLATIRPSIRFDNRNDPFVPSKGSYLEAAFEQGWGTFTFPKLTLEGRQHFTTGSRPDGSGKRILTLRGFFGASGRDTPIYERFFAGDFRSLRGFALRGVGPHTLNVNTGGIMSLLGSVEYQFPWTANDKFAQVFFADFGTAEQNYSITDFRVSVGTGIRLTIPQLTKNLPLAFDIAYPLVKAEGDRTRYFTFFIGAFW